MYLGNNLLTGPLPPSWGSWKAVKELDFEANRHVGNVPSTWGGLGKTLEYVGLKGNPDLTGCLPRGLEGFEGNTDTCDNTAMTCKVC